MRDVSATRAGAGGSRNETRGRVLKAAFALFTERGFAGTSMLEIATHAKVSKRDLYALFADKHALLKDCIEQRAHAMRRALDPATPLPADKPALSAMLTEFGAEILRAVSRPEVLMLYRLAISESDRAPDVARLLDAAGRQANIDALSEFITRAQARGLVDAGDPVMLATRYTVLLWGDLLVRLLLRVREVPDAAEIALRARGATDALMAQSVS
jgi:AcrR family transcriptional regulator